MVPRSLRDESGRRSILDRLAALSPEHPRLWGRMKPAQLLPHLTGGLRLALGERRLEAVPPGPVRGALLRYLAIYMSAVAEGEDPVAARRLRHTQPRVAAGPTDRCGAD